MNEAFFTVHRDLPRQGPGTPADVHWALQRTGLSGALRICDAGCGPGADSETLAEALPESRIDALDAVEHLIGEAQARLARFGDRVVSRVGDMAAITGPYDLIWCAGALYFLGVTEGLTTWRDALAPGGWIAFSEPVWVSDTPSQAARAFWEEYPAITDLDGIEARVAAAGFRMVDHRLITGRAWEAYYGPMAQRLDRLETGAVGADLADAITETRAEISRWTEAPDEIAYALVLAQPA